MCSLSTVLVVVEAAMALAVYLALPACGLPLGECLGLPLLALGVIHSVSK